MRRRESIVLTEAKTNMKYLPSGKHQHCYIQAKVDWMVVGSHEGFHKLTSECHMISKGWMVMTSRWPWEREYCKLTREVSLARVAEKPYHEQFMVDCKRRVNIYLGLSCILVLTGHPDRSPVTGLVGKYQHSWECSSAWGSEIYPILLFLFFSFFCSGTHIMQYIFLQVNIVNGRFVC